MDTDVFLRSYHVKHKICMKEHLCNARKIANHAVLNKNNKKTNELKKYNSILWSDGLITIVPLKMTFRWNPGRTFEKINQIEIDEEKFMISVTYKLQKANMDATDLQSAQDDNILGIDHNCGFNRHILNCANLKTGHVLNLGKIGPKIRQKYFKKRKTQKIKGHKEKRIMKDLDHKISRAVVNYALQNKLRIVVEDLKGIRYGSKKGKGSKAKNRVVNSWSFYRLQSFIEYKAKELNIPFTKINPHYTSQECSYCGVIGTREKETFICNNKRCCKHGVKRNSDINAAFNIGKRSLQEGGSPE